jgi:hypothetical protein
MNNMNNINNMDIGSTTIESPILTFLPTSCASRLLNPSTPLTPLTVELRRVMQDYVLNSPWTLAFGSGSSNLDVGLPNTSFDSPIFGFDSTVVDVESPWTAYMNKLSTEDAAESPWTAYMNKLSTEDALNTSSSAEEESDVILLSPPSLRSIREATPRNLGLGTRRPLVANRGKTMASLTTHGKTIAVPALRRGRTAEKDMPATEPTRRSSRGPSRRCCLCTVVSTTKWLPMSDENLTAFIHYLGDEAAADAKMMEIASASEAVASQLLVCWSCSRLHL